MNFTKTFLDETSKIISDLSADTIEIMAEKLSEVIHSGGSEPGDKPVNLKNNKWLVLAFTANLLVICLVYILFMNLNYPLVGHDYTQVVPYLLDILLHFRNNGFSIQWYTSSFGGGLPAFPSPNNTQYSIPAALTLFFEPWVALNLSAVILVSAGFYACFRLFYRVLKLNWMTAILGAVFFSANGFMLERLAVGHTGFEIFAVLPVLIIACLDTSIPVPTAAILIALIAALAIHGAGYIILVIFGLSALITFPIIYIFRPKLFSWKRFFSVAVLGVVTALLISASKLAAVFSFMHFFPRLIADNPIQNPWLGLLGIILQLLGTMNLLPLFWAANIKPILLQNMMVSVSGAGYGKFVFGYWEFDMSLSPVIFWIILIALFKNLRSPRKPLAQVGKDFKWIAVLLLIFSSVLCVELTLARGSLYQLFRNLPMLDSLHVNLRYATAFIFPLCLLAAIALNGWLAILPKKQSMLLFVVINIFTLLPLGTYFFFGNDPQNRNYDISASKSIYADIRAGAPFVITSNGVMPDYTQALIQRTSNLNPYEPIFGYFLENFHPEAKPGSVWDVSGGYYNMTDPTGYVFPEINGSRPFALIPLAEKAEMTAFVNHFVPDWKIPLRQQILDWVSLISSIIAGLIFSGYLLQPFWKRFTGQPTVANSNQ